MVSKAKARANRRNAQKSTGPRSEEGKKKCSRNALRHGVFCRDVLLDGENEELFEIMRQSFIDRLMPQDLLELSLVERIVADQWRLNRLEEAEQVLYETRRMGHQNKLEDFLEGKLSRDERVNQWWERFDDVETEKAKKDPAYVALCSTMGAAFMTMHALMGDEQNQLERHQKLRNYLHNSISRAMRELRHLRPKDGPPPGPSPYSEQHNAELRELARKMELDVDEDEFGDEEELEKQGEQGKESESQNEATAAKAVATAEPVEACAPAAAATPSPDVPAHVLSETVLQVQLDEMEQLRGDADES